jgi:hypothetical protein
MFGKQMLSCLCSFTFPGSHSLRKVTLQHSLSQEIELTRVHSATLLSSLLQQWLCSDGRVLIANIP